MPWLLAALYDRVMRTSEEACLAAWRRELLAGAAGEVLEIGAGTGANLAAYGPEVTRLTLTEPDAAMRRKLARRLADRRIEGAVVVAAGADRLPFADGSFDAVVSTLVLCSVRDPARVLAEVRRVLRPGGRLHVMEHVGSDDPSRAAWQRRLEPVWARVADGCHLTRRTEQAIVDAGFTFEWVARESIRKAMPLARPSVRGVARLG